MLMLPEIPARQGGDLLHMVRAISEKLEIGEVTRRCLKFVVRILAGQGGIIALRHADGSFSRASELGVDPEQLTIFDDMLSELIAGRSILHEPANAPRDMAHHDTVYRDSVHRDTVHLEEKFNEIAAALDPDWRQTIPIALSFEQELLGILFVFRSYQSEVSEYLAQALQTIAAQAAIAIHHAGLFRNIREERQRLAKLVEYSENGILILDSAFRAQNLNPALERISGWPAAEALGRPYDELLDWRERDGLNLRETIAAQRPENGEAPPSLYHEGEIFRRDGSTAYIGATHATLYPERDGALLGVIVNVRDLSDKKREQEQQNLFISTISHELKTPVALIKGYAHTLLRNDAQWERETITDGLQVIDEEADRLDSLIENLLHASRLQAQEHLILDIGDVYLPQLVEQLAARFRTQSSAHRINLRFPPDFPVIQADEERIREVFANLLSNALKYSPAGGDVEIGGERRDQETLLYVRDEGMGIDEREKERIFERFYRVDGALTRSTEGAGLGLYLARAIVNAHGGRLMLRSVPGRGSIFYFTLPIVAKTGAGENRP